MLRYRRFKAHAETQQWRTERADKAVFQDTLQHSLRFLCEDLDSLAALGWLAFEHVAVVRLRG